MGRRHGKADRTEKKRLLAEAEVITGLHRKGLIHRLNGDLAQKPRKRQRGLSYGPALPAARRVIGESAARICTERRQPNLVWKAQHQAGHGEMEVTPELPAHLGRISISTVRRILGRLGQGRPRLPRPDSPAVSCATHPYRPPSGRQLRPWPRPARPGSKPTAGRTTRARNSCGRPCSNWARTTALCGRAVVSPHTEHTVRLAETV
jgi:hypothetical protein